MFELNRAERQSLVMASILIVGGAALRTGIGPGREAFSWRPATVSRADRPATLREVSAAVEEGVARETEAARPLGKSERLDPNSASEVQLRRLPGVGAVRARAIVEARRTAVFRSPRDLLRVTGIGEVMLARILPHLSLPGGSPDGVVEMRVDVNAAGLDQLIGLPWIGPSRATEIIATRRRLGAFRSIDELIEVPGIGPQILERLRPYLYVVP